jgi:hypothetical protein
VPKARRWRGGINEFCPDAEKLLCGAKTKSLTYFFFIRVYLYNLKDGTIARFNIK